MSLTFLTFNVAFAIYTYRQTFLIAQICKTPIAIKSYRCFKSQLRKCEMSTFILPHIHVCYIIIYFMRIFKSYLPTHSRFAAVCVNGCSSLGKFL